MELFNFQEFLALVKHLNYSLAAEEVAVSESTLSRHIQAMEKELGVTLFNRTSRRVELNQYGQIFIPYAKQVIAIEQRYTQELNEAKKHSKSTVVLGTAYYIHDLIAKFHLHSPEIAITTINYDNNDELFKALNAGMCELIFIINPQNLNSEYKILTYESDTYVAVLPITHKLADREFLALNELAKDDFISFKLESNSDINIKNFCRKAGFEPRVVLTGEVGSAIADFVRQGIGVSILQQKTINKMMPNGIALVNIKPAIPLEVFLCYRKDAKLSEASHQFIDYVTHEWKT